MNLSPVAIQKFFDSNGAPLVGGKLFTYVTGTTTKTATYSDEAGTPNTNPVVMDYRGECRLWLDPTQTYTFVLAPANDTDPPTNAIWTQDDIAAPLLTDQENTWTETQTFTASGHITPAVNLSSAAPALHVTESDQSANNKIWYLQGQGGLFQLGVLNDAKDNSANWCQVTRSGVTISSVTFPTSTVGSFVVGSASPVGLTGVATVTAPASTNGLVVHIPSDGSVPLVVWNSDSSGDNIFQGFYTEAGGTLRGSINYNRGGGLTAFNTTSDRRLKTNITDAPDAGALVDSLKVRSFDWINGPHVDYWLVAQEVYDVLPLAVTKGDDGEAVERQWSVDPSKLVPLLLKAIQELRARVAALESP